MRADGGLLTLARCSMRAPSPLTLSNTRKGFGRSLPGISVAISIISAFSEVTLDNRCGLWQRWLSQPLEHSCDLRDGLGRTRLLFQDETILRGEPMFILQSADMIMVLFVPSSRPKNSANLCQ